MNYRTWACTLGLAFVSSAQAQPCVDAFKRSGSFLSGSRYTTQAAAPGVAAAVAFARVQRFTADNGFTVQSADAASGRIQAAQTAQLAKGKQVPLEITVRDGEGGAVIALDYATGAGQLSPEGAIKDHFCKTIAAASSGDTAPAPTAAATPPPPAAADAPPDSEFIKNGQPCLSGLCIGDPVPPVPAQPWETQNPRLSPQKRVPAPPGQVDLLARTVHGPRASLQRVANASLAGAFDADALRALGELTAVCGPFQPTGYFKSRSGHVTTVQLAPGMDSAGKLQFRVAYIARTFDSAISVDQQREVTAALQQQYGPIVQAHRTLKGQRFDLPTADIGRQMGSNAVQVQLMEAGHVRQVQGQLLLKHPACGGAAPVKLE